MSDRANIIRWFSLTVIGFFTLNASASIVHFQPDGNGQFTTSSLGRSVDELLTDLGLNVPSYETTATTFLVPGTAQDDVLLRFTFVEDSGAANGIFGFFPIAAVAHLDIETQTSQWINTATNEANRTIVFDDSKQRPTPIPGTVDTNDPSDPNTPGFERTVVVEGGIELGFVLWTNGLDGSQGGTQRLFSDQRANPDGNDPGTLGDDMLLAFSGDSTTLMDQAGDPLDLTLFTFEDVIFGDDDYTDLAFTVTPELLSGELGPPESVPAPAPLYLLGAGLALMHFRRQTSAYKS